MAASRSSIEAGKGHVTLSTEKSALEKGLDEAKKKLQDWGASAIKIGAGIAAAGAAIKTTFYYGLSVFNDSATVLRTMSRETGIATERLSALAYAFADDADAVPRAVQHIANFIEAASRGGEAGQKLARLGLTFDHLANADRFDQLMMIADALASVGNATERAALAQQVLGRGAAISLGPRLAQGSAGIRERMQQAQDRGFVISSADQAAANAYAATMRELNLTIKAMWVQAGAAVAKYVTEFIAKVTNLLQYSLKWMEQNRGLLLLIFRIGEAIFLTGTAIAIFGAGVFTLGKMFGIVTSAVGTVVSILMFFVTNPIGITILAIAAAVYTLYTRCDAARRGIDGLVSSLASVGGDTIQGIADALTAGDLDLAAQIAFASLKIAWLDVTDSIKDIWHTTINWIASALAQSIGGWSLAWLEFQNLLQLGWSVIVGAFEIGWNTFRTGAEIAYQAAQAALGGYDAAQAAESAAAVGRARERQIVLRGGIAMAEREAELERERARITREVNAQIAIINAPNAGDAAGARAERDRLRGELAALNQQAADQRAIADAERQFNAMMNAMAVGGGGAAFGAGGAGSVAGTFNAAQISGFLGAHRETAAERNARLQLEEQQRANRLIQNVVDAVMRIRGVAFV
jgi:hypothetical protein